MTGLSRHIRILILIAANLSGNIALQNAEAERHCQMFLTDPKTAPISTSAKRELEADSISETWCKKVLDDENLPLNIRGVIMEGKCTDTI